MLEIVREYIPEVMAALVAFLTAILSYAVTVIKAKVTEKINDEEMHHIIDNVVRYVEQKAKTLGTMTSEEKKALAIEKAQEWLMSKGITVSDTELEILIEAAVQGLQNGVKASKTKGAN